MAHTTDPLDITAELSHDLEQFRDPETKVDLKLVSDVRGHRDALRALMSELSASENWEMLETASHELSEVNRIINKAYADAQCDAAKVEELLEFAEIAGPDDGQGIAEELENIVWDDSGKPDPLLILKQLAPEKHREFVDVMRRGIELYDRLRKTPHYTVIATQTKWDANAASAQADAELRQGRLSA